MITTIQKTSQEDQDHRSALWDTTIPFSFLFYKHRTTKLIELYKCASNLNYHTLNPVKVEI